MRETFHKQLDTLRARVQEMAKMARGMLADGAESLVELDREKAKRVEALAAPLADLDSQIEEEALMLVARQQPMARDMRAIAAALKLITYINRVGRYGKDIAAITTHWPNVPHKMPLEHLRQMTSTVLEMLDMVMTAYRTDLRFDVEKLRKWETSVDNARWTLWHQCVAFMTQNPSETERGAHYMMVARYLERCGDNICKIAEKTHYVATGQRITIR